MNQITPKQLNELLDIIKFYHIAFIVEHIGKEFLTEEDIKLLKNFGIDINNIQNIDTIGISFKFGILSEALSKSQAEKLEYEDFRKYIKSPKFIPLSKQEQLVLDSIKKQTTNDIKGLAEKAANEIGDRILTEERRQQMIDAITEEEQKAVEERKSMKQLVIDIQDRTEDWGRNFSKIVDFRSNTAFQEGRVMAIKNEDENSLIYKQVYAGSCKHCIRVYLTNGIGSEPRLFTPAELEANGDNIGRKSNDLKAVIGSTHVHCRCTVHKKLPGTKWNPETQQFDKYEENWKPKVTGINAPKITKD
jgi:hypothetical protein